MRVPRWVHRIRVFFGGWFWGPCAHCGFMFGGHEWGRVIDTSPHESSIPDGFTASSGIAICPRCTRSGVGCQAWAALGRYHFGCGFAPLPEKPDAVVLRRISLEGEWTP